MCDFQNLGRVIQWNCSQKIQWSFFGMSWIRILRPFKKTGHSQFSKNFFKCPFFLWRGTDQNKKIIIFFFTKIFWRFFFYNLKNFWNNIVDLNVSFLPELLFFVIKFCPSSSQKEIFWAFEWRVFSFGNDQKNHISVEILFWLIFPKDLS